MHTAQTDKPSHMLEFTAENDYTEKRSPLISVIIPCYNVEDYVDRCMESLLRQTIGFSGLEVILVNDASTDDTLSRLQEWERRYPDNIMVITYEENLRQGGARNIGISYASAEYIGFVDSDDWIAPEMYEALWAHVQEGYDIIRCKLIREHAPGEHVIDEPTRRDQAYHFGKKQGFYDHDVPDTGDNGEYGGIYTAIYRKSLLAEHSIVFPEKLAYEDNYWMSMVQLYARNLYIVDRILYHYFINMHSTTTAKNAAHQFDRLEIELSKLDEYRARGAFEVFHDRIEWEFVRLFYLNSLYILFTRFDEIPTIVNDMRRVVVEQFPNYKENAGYVQCNARERLLLSLIDIPRELSAEELQRLRQAYRNTF